MDLIIDDKSRRAVNSKRTRQSFGSVNGFCNAGVGSAGFNGLDIDPDFFQRTLQQGRINAAVAENMWT